MSSDIMLALDWNKEGSRSRITTVREHSGCESSFFTSCILADQIKKKHKTVLIMFHQHFEHYHNVGLKLGYNLRNMQTSGLVTVFSPTHYFIDNLFKGDQIVLSVEILKFIKEQLHDTASELCIYIEGLTHMLDLGYSINEINSLVREIMKLSSERDCSLVFSCAVTSEDDNSSVIAGLLSHMSDTVVECESLKSGRSADVSGHLTVRHIGQRYSGSSDVGNSNAPPTKYNFRLFDRGVRLFAPGEKNSMSNCNRDV